MLPDEEKKRLMYYATRQEQGDLLEFFKSRGLFIIPQDFKTKNFSEQALLSGKISVCNLSPLSLKELKRYPVYKKTHKNFWHSIDSKYPIIKWKWATEEESDGERCNIDGRFHWLPASETWNPFLPEKHKSTHELLDAKYIPYNKDMKAHFGALQRWIRKNWDNLEKGNASWYSPIIKSQLEKGEVLCGSSLPGTVDMTTIFVDKDGKKSGEVTTRDWNVFNMLGKKRSRK